jgi:colanic acid/amylovoran biosynthesis glycosyltransferase
LPVVATDVSGIPELIENEKTGLLVPQRDPQSFAKALKRIYSEAGLAKRMGTEARKKVNQVFDADRCIDVCEALLAPYGK